MLAALRDWAIDRFGLAPIFKHVLFRRVPKTPWYYGDGASLVLLFGVLVVTGMVLALTYSPSPDGAYESVEEITSRQTLGWFVRGLHYWSAGLMAVMLFAHLLRQILVAGYKFPREGTWLLGLVLFFGFLTMSYLGYVLRWDQRAIHALEVSLHMLYRVPYFGINLVEFVRGGEQIGPRTLTRFYSLHVIILPLILGLLVGYHLYLVIVRGITSPAEQRQPIRTSEEQRRVYKEAAQSEEEGEPFHPDTAFQSGVMASVVLGIALTLTLVVGPRPLDDKADFITQSMPAEEWWFWWYSGLIALLPANIAPSFFVLFPPLVFLALALLPLIDRGPYRGMRKRPVAVGFVILVAIVLIGLSDLRRRSPWTGWPDPRPPSVPPGVTLSEQAEQGRQLFAAYGCTSCHAISGEGREVGSDLSLVERRSTRAEIRAYTLQPPDGISMPAYEGRISDEDLERIVEFCHVAQTFPRQQ